MPTYEYACPDCDHEFERFQSITANPVKTCPECGKRKVHRLISKSSFILKGGGWYADGYSDKKSSDKSSSKSETKSESKSETKSETKSTTKSDSGSKSGGDKKPKSKGSSAAA